MRERFSTRDTRFLAACLVVLVLTVWFSAKFFYRAFPEASIDFVVTRAQARVLAEQFLAGQGQRLDGYRQASRFSYDDRAKTFLERELGLERANQLMGRQVRLWRWSYRWFRPLEKEEFRVDITPRGETAGFEHLIAEAAPRASLSADQARTLAENFLRQNMRRDPAALEFLESSSITRPARTDHTFTWKQRDFSVKDATYRLEVTVQGDQAGGYREYLKVPETWLRDYDRLRSRNEAAQSGDTVVVVLLAVGVLVTLLIRVRNRDVRWRPAATFGAAGAVLFFLSSWNQQPLVEFGYPTTDSYSSFVARRILQSLVGALTSGGFIFVLTAAAEPLYRQFFRGRISLGNLFRRSSLRTKSFFLGCVLGLTLTGLFVAYQTAFYLLAYRWGAWAPADVPYDDLLNTRFPWLFVLFGGFFPAVSEEFLFRMFSIPFLQKLARSTWAALVLAGFIWGFGHAGYPQQPFYIRGVEVGIGGVFLGLVMLRWGILPTLVWHYSVDALYTALLLLRSHNLYFVLSGAASAGIMLLPLAAAWMAYVRGKGFEPETELTNEREGSSVAVAEPEAPAPPPAAFPYQTWPTQRRLAALVLFAVAMGSLLLPVERFGDAPRFALGAEQARSAGDDFLRGSGFDPRAFRHVVYPISRWSGETGKYFLERRPLAYLKDAYRRHVPLYGWAVRYYKPLEKEEVRVWFDPETAGMAGFEHSLPEDRPGADLAPPAARKIAADYLTARGFDLQTLELKETEAEKQKARRDYTLVWEARPGDVRNLDEAHYRVRVRIAGDRVAGLETFWKLPEAYVRARTRRNALSNILLALRIFSFSAAVVAGVWILVQRTRRRELRWGRALAIALPVAALSLLGNLSDFRMIFRGYNTAIGPEVFLGTMIAFVAIGTIGTFLGLCGAAGLLLALLPEAPAALRPQNRRRLAFDALRATVLGMGLVVALGQIRWFLLDRFHTQALVSVSAPDLFGAAVPAVSALGGAATGTLFGLALWGLVIHLARSAFHRRWPVIVAALVALAAFVPSQVHTIGEFALQYGVVLFSAAVLAAWCVWFGRNNYLAYALAFCAWAVGRSALELLNQPAAALQRQGWWIAAALALVLVWAVAPAFRGPRQSAMPGPP